MAEEPSAAFEDAERRGDPFLHWLDGHGHQQVLSLNDSWQQITIGRGPSSDVGLPWDSDVSRVHAELVRIGDDWAVVDDGLSRNGTFVGGERVVGRKRLRDGDELRCGATQIGFRAPFEVADPTRVID